MLMNNFRPHYIHPPVEQLPIQTSGPNIFTDWIQEHGYAPPPPADPLPNGGLDIFAQWLHDHPPVLIGIA